MRLASLFPGTNSPRVRSISGLLLSLENFPHFLPLSIAFPASRVRQSMVRTGTAGTPTLSKPDHRAGVLSVPDGTISFAPPYRAK